MLKRLLFLTLILTINLSHSQEVGEIREVELILMDMPISGEAISTNFMTADSSDYPYFDDNSWLDKHLPLYTFFHTYRDSCYEHNLHFNVTMIYIPMEQFDHRRFQGYMPTGEVANTWVLTSIVRKEDDDF